MSELQSKFMSELCFDANCKKCPRLVAFLAEVKRDHPNDHAAPVAPFGDENPDLLIVGLAPGMHGANATGRPFTGDHAGILLYRTLYAFGFSTAPESISYDDGLKLRGARITNAVKCLPPQNKPVAEEVNFCNSFLQNELVALKKGAVILALGSTAHKATVKALKLKQKDFPFKHGLAHKLENGRILLNSYHCSRYNTQTKRLTEAMFQDVFQQAQDILNREFNSKVQLSYYV